MPPKQNPIDSLAEATNARLGRLEEAIEKQGEDLSQAIKAQGDSMAQSIRELNQSIQTLGTNIDQQGQRMEAAIEKQGLQTQASIEKLPGKMDTFLEGLNRMERGIDRMVRSWESQNRFLQEVVQRQNQSTERLQALADQQMQMLNKALDAMVFSKN